MSAITNMKSTEENVTVHAKSIEVLEEQEAPSDRLLEQETIVRFDETGKAAALYTASKRVAARLIKAGHAPTRITKRKGSKEVIAWWFSMPTAAVLIKCSGKSVRLGVQRRDPNQAKPPATPTQVKNLEHARASKRQGRPQPETPPVLF